MEVYEKKKNTPFFKEVIDRRSTYLPYGLYSEKVMRKLELFSTECTEDSYTVTKEGDDIT